MVINAKAKARAKESSISLFLFFLVFIHLNYGGPVRGNSCPLGRIRHFASRCGTPPPWGPLSSGESHGLRPSRARRIGEGSEGIESQSELIQFPLV